MSTKVFQLLALVAFLTVPNECAEDTKTTSSKGPTPTPATQTIGKWNVSSGEDDNKCIMLWSDLKVTVTYKTKNGTKNAILQFSPNSTVDEDGSTCNGTVGSGGSNGDSQEELLSAGSNDMQKMVLNYDNDTNIQLTLYFTDAKRYTLMTADGSNWVCYNALFKVGDTSSASKLFPDAKESSISIENKINYTTGNGAIHFLLGIMNYSIDCVTGYHEYLVKDQLYVDMANVKVQAFASSSDFARGDLCKADITSADIIPIIVGACLAGLVVIVLIAYLIGRARARSSGYHSV